MATYPCSIGMHRYGGAQRSAYISLIEGRDPETRKLRLCAKHFDLIREGCVDVLDFLDPEDDGQQMSTICQACSGAPRQMTVSVKLYPGGDDAHQYAGDFCGACAPGVLDGLGWEQGAEM